MRTHGNDREPGHIKGQAEVTEATGARYPGHAADATTSARATVRTFCRCAVRQRPELAHRGRVRAKSTRLLLREERLRLIANRLLSSARCRPHTPQSGGKLGDLPLYQR